MTASATSPADPAPLERMSVAYGAFWSAFAAWHKTHACQVSAFRRLFQPCRGVGPVTVTTDGDAMLMSASASCGVPFHMPVAGRFEDYLAAEVTRENELDSSAESFTRWRDVHQGHGGLSVELRDTNVCMVTTVRCACGAATISSMI